METKPGRLSKERHASSVGRNALRGIKNIDIGKKPHSPEKETNEPRIVEVGSLVVLLSIESGKEINIYISEHEKNIQDLDISIQKKLPKGIMIQPLNPSTSSTTRSSERLIDRLYKKSVGDTFELLNNKNKAKILSIVDIGYKAKSDVDLESHEPDL